MIYQLDINTEICDKDTIDISTLDIVYAPFTYTYLHDKPISTLVTVSLMSLIIILSLYPRPI